jgi:uncharacterized protein YecE (DUF72 family)
MPAPPYYLGCPVWVCDAWVGSVYAGKSRTRWLADYTQAFNSVEGNSTFYALPKGETVERWADEAADGFRFVLKFPRTVTHDKMLFAAEHETEAFLSLLAILRRTDKLGPSMIQLPPYFDAAKLVNLEAFLARLPREFPYAVEVRHDDFFDSGPAEHALDALLAEYRVDRVLFDSRPLFSAPPTDDFEVESQGRKPQVPVRFTTTSGSPVVRFIARNDVPSVETWINEWVSVVADWLARGLTPYFFTHAPNNAFAPAVAALFHTRLMERVPDLPPLPAWPGQVVQKQQSLF